MSLWTSIRDAVESVASVAGNYALPGSSIITGQLVSKGAQKQLSSPVGMLAQLGSGLAGAGVGSDITGIPSANSAGFGWGGAYDMMSGMGSTPGSTLGASTSGLGSDVSGNDFAATPGTAGTGAGFNPQTEEEMLALQRSQQGMRMSNLGTDKRSGFFDNLLGGGDGSGKSGSMPWGSVGNLMTMGSGLYGLMQSQQLSQLGKQMQTQADPFGPYRQQYAQQMAMLSANPGLITQQPGYAAGLQALQRSGAAQGYTGSGNMAAAIPAYAGDFFNKTMSNYGQLAGAGFNPANAGQLNMQGQFGSANLALNSLGLLGKGAVMAQQPGG